MEKSNATFDRAMERLRAGARGQESPGATTESYVALYHDHCAAVVNEIERLQARLVDAALDIEEFEGGHPWA